MKLQISLSCVEDDLFQALLEAKKIMIALNGVFCEVKVYHSWEEKSGHSWIKLTENCDPMDKIEIYKLQKEIELLKSKQNQTT